MQMMDLFWTITSQSKLVHMFKTPCLFRLQLVAQESNR